MTSIGPRVLARRMARSCVLNIGWAAEAVADAAISEEGVVLRHLFACLGHFVSAQIKRSDDKFFTRRELNALLVRLEVRLFVRLDAAGEPQVLRAVEPDALAAHGGDFLDLLGQFNVPHDADVHAIHRDGRQASQFGGRSRGTPAAAGWSAGTPRASGGVGFRMTVPISPSTMIC